MAVFPSGRSPLTPTLLRGVQSRRRTLPALHLTRQRQSQRIQQRSSTRRCASLAANCGCDFC